MTFLGRTAESLAIVLSVGALTAPAAAQVTIGADVGLFSDYVWRGVTYTNQPVIQPSLYLGLPVAGATITVGGWANVELARYDDPSDISVGGGLEGPDLAEFDWWAEYERTSGIVTYAVGALGYVFPNDDDATLTSDDNTVEVYGRLGLDHAVSPQIEAWYDVDKIKGAYVETRLGYSVPLSENFALDLGALAGFSAGQAVNDEDPDESFNFEDDGLTHVDLSASTEFIAGQVSIAPELHFVIANDEITKFTEPDETNDTKVWFGAMLSWSSDSGEDEVEPPSEPEAP